LDKDGVTIESVDDVVKSHYSELEECSKHAREINENVSGKLAFKWTITRSGAVKDVVIIENKTGDRVLADCFVTTLKKMRFSIENTSSLSKGFKAVVEYYPFVIK
jgi:hypothetical protein